MATTRRRGGRYATLGELRVQLIPHFDPDKGGRERKAVVQQIMGLMFINLHKRGRPKKTDGGVSDAA